MMIMMTNTRTPAKKSPIVAAAEASRDKALGIVPAGSASESEIVKLARQQAARLAGKGLQPIPPEDQLIK